MKIINTKQPSRDHFLSFVWLMLFILPNNLFFYLFVPVSFVLLYNPKSSLKLRTGFIIAAAIITLFVTLLININEDYVQNNDYFRLISLILFFFTFGKLKGNKILRPYIYIVIFFLVATQFSFGLNIPFLTNIVKTVYNTSEYGEFWIGNSENFQFSNFGITRLGGIYFNPNILASFLQLILITLLCEIDQFRKRDLVILLPIMLASIIATGSRTSFVVLVTIAIGYLFFTKRISLRKLVMIGIIFASIGVYLLANVDFSEYRALKIDEGLDDSFGVKMAVLGDYFDTNPSLMALLFGNLSPMFLITRHGSDFLGTDFDLGNILILYGVVFFIIYIILLIFTCKKMQPQYRVFFAILLWTFSNSIICSYRMAPLFFLTLGLYYRRSILETLNK